MCEHFVVKPRFCTNDIEVSSLNVMRKCVLVTPLTVLEAEQLADELSGAVAELRRRQDPPGGSYSLRR
jgi:hypothetical protein